MHGAAQGVASDVALVHTHACNTHVTRAHTHTHKHAHETHTSRHTSMCACVCVCYMCVCVCLRVHMRVTCVRACVFLCVCMRYMCVHVCYMCVCVLHVCVLVCMPVCARVTCVCVCVTCVCVCACVLQLSDLSQVDSECTKCQLGALLTALSGQRKNHKCAHRTRLNRDRRARLRVSPEAAR